MDDGRLPRRSPITSYVPAAAAVAGIVVGFALLGALGAAQAARGERVLGQIDPVMAALRVSGRDLMLWLGAQTRNVSLAITTIAVLLVAGGCLRGIVRSVPLVLLAGAVVSATWGQAALIADQPTRGVVLYAVGALCALALGIWRPMTQLAGFPQMPPLLPRRAAGVPRAAAPRSPWYEVGIVVGLGVLGIIARLYALTELPNGFDIEMIQSTVLSGSQFGLGEYARWAFRTNTTGIMHLFPQTAFFALFGTSLYSLRLAAVVWGVASLPLLYWLVRRIAGIGPAVAATLWFIAAPEQLFWTRSETTNFAPIAFLALVSANLGIWMVRRFAWAAVLANTLWMPVCRFFYMPGIIMFLYPILLLGHALVCLRGAWRRAWYAAPLLLVGVGLWFASLTTMYGLVDGRWDFVNPGMISGQAPWSRQGELTTTTPLQLARLQVESIAKRLGQVAAGMAYRTGFSQWYQRVDPTQRPTLINVGIVLTGALGMAYLLGQLRDRGAWALLALIGLGVLPGLLSTEAADRRIALMFPALTAACGVMIGATVRVVRECAGRLLGYVTMVAVSVGVVLVAWTSAASFFLLPMTPVHLDQMFAFTRTIFADSDVVFHDLDSNVGLAVVFGNLDRFVGTQPACYDAVTPARWVDNALQARCDFTSVGHRLTLPPARLEAARSTPARRISFLSSRTARNEAHIRLLRALYPNGQWRQFPSPYAELNLVAVTVTADDIKTLRRPSWTGGADVGSDAEWNTRLLAGVPLQHETAPATPLAAREIVVQGGFYLEREGWYRYALRPACATAALTVDGQPASAAVGYPMLAGIHGFALRLADPTDCALPLEILLARDDQSTFTPLPPAAYVSMSAAAYPEVRATAVETYDGYGEPRVVMRAGPEGMPIDFDVDAQGNMAVLLRAPNGFRVQRIGADGGLGASWPVQAPDTQGWVGIVQLPDGAVLVAFSASAQLFDPSGTPRAAWKEPPLYTSGLAQWRDGRVLSAVPHEMRVVLLNGDAAIEHSWNQFAGGLGRFEAPVSVTTNDAGDVLVIENEGMALLFRNEGADFAPVFVTRFPLALSELPVRTAGVAIDDRRRILIPEPTTGQPLVYDFAGRRMLATDPARDLSRKSLSAIAKFKTTPAALYVLSRDGTLWRMER